MMLAYIAGPYRGKHAFEIRENIMNAERVMIELIHLGAAVFCPHKNTALLDGVFDDDVFLMIDADVLKRSDCIVMIEGWGNSEGARREKEIAEAQKMPVFYWPVNKKEIAKYITGF